MEASGNSLLIVHLPVQHEQVLYLRAYDGRSSLCIKQHLRHQKPRIGHSSRVPKFTGEGQALLAEYSGTIVFTLAPYEPCQGEERVYHSFLVIHLLIKHKCLLQQGLCAAQISIPGNHSKYLQGRGTLSRVSYFSK